MRGAVRFTESSEIPPLPPKLNMISSPRGRARVARNSDESSVVSESSKSTGSNQEDNVARLNLAGRTPHAKQTHSNNAIEMLKENLLFTDKFSFPPPEINFNFSTINTIQSTRDSTISNVNPLSDISNKYSATQTKNSKKENVSMLQTVGIADRKTSKSSMSMTFTPEIHSNLEEIENKELNVSIVSPASDQNILADTSIMNSSRIMLSNSMHVMESGGSNFRDDELNTSTSTTRGKVYFCINNLKSLENKAISRPNAMLSIPQSKKDQVQRKTVSYEKPEVIVSSKPSLSGRRSNSPSLNHISNATSNNINLHNPASMLVRNKLLVSNLHVDSSAVSPFTPDEMHHVLGQDHRQTNSVTTKEFFHSETYTENHVEQSYINLMLLGSQDSQQDPYEKCPSSDITTDDVSSNVGVRSVASTSPQQKSSTHVQRKLVEVAKVSSPPSDSENSTKSVNAAKIFHQGGVSLRGRGPSPGPSHRMSASFIEHVPMCAVSIANQVIGKPYSNRASTLTHASNAVSSMNTSTVISLANRSICSESRSVNNKPLMSQKAMSSNTAAIDRPTVKGTTPRNEKKKPPTMPTTTAVITSTVTTSHMEKKERRKEKKSKTVEVSVKAVDKRKVSPATSVVSSLTEPQFEAIEKATRPKGPVDKDLGKPQRAVSNQRAIHRSASAEALEESISLRQKDIIHELLIRPDNYLGELFNEKFNNFNDQPNYSKIGYSDEDSCISTIESSLYEALGGRKLSPPVEVKSSPIFMSYRKIHHASDSENDEVELGLSDLLKVDSMGMAEVGIYSKSRKEATDVEIETVNPIAAATANTVSPKKTLSISKSKSNSLSKSAYRLSLGSAQRISRRQAEIEEIKAIEVPRSVQKKSSNHSSSKSNRSKIMDESRHNISRSNDYVKFRKQTVEMSKSMDSFAEEYDTINTNMAVLPEDNTYTELNSASLEASQINMSLAETTMTLDHSYLLNSSGLFR